MDPKQLLHLDADESIFFLRELEHVKTKSYDKKYPELKARSLIPVSYDADPADETIVYEQYDGVGVAKIIASYADDIPRADIKGKEFVSVIRGMASSYAYNLQEIRKASKAGKPLQTKKADAAKRALMQLEDNIAFLGDSEYGLLGLLNHPNISNTTIANDGSGSLTTFASKTAAQIVRDLNKIVNYVVENTKEVEKPNTLLLPTEQYNLIASTAYGDDANKTILKFFLDHNPYIKEVISVPKLKGAGAMGVDRMIAYVKDSDHLTLEVPQDFEQLDVEQRNMEKIVPCHMRTGGVLIYYPLSVAYVDGI